MKASRLFAVGFFLTGIAPLAASAQALPPTPQQLQQQHNQAIQNESNTAHGNLTQLQIQQPQQPSPTLSRSGRAIAHPPGYIPAPRH
jgi:hypothetical protein